MIAKEERSGFSMLELVIVIAIIGILAALTLPAIQSARATARNLECRNYLKQIGIACHNYESRERVFPSLGFHVYQDLHREFGVVSPVEDGSIQFYDDGFPALYCPSDPWIDRERPSFSYLMNNGTRAGNGYEGFPEPRSARDITDGQSMTTAFSERLVIPNYHDDDVGSEAPERFPWWTEAVIPRPSDTFADDFAAMCRGRRTSPFPVEPWLPQTVIGGVRSHSNAKQYRLLQRSPPPGRSNCRAGASQQPARRGCQCSLY